MSDHSVAPGPSASGRKAFRALVLAALALTAVAAALTLLGVGAVAEWVDDGLAVTVGGHEWLGEQMPWEHGVGAALVLFVMLLLALTAVLVAVPLALTVALGVIAFGLGAVLLLATAALLPLLLPAALLWWLLRHRPGRMTR